MVPTPARLVAAIDPTEAAPPARRSQPAQEPPEQTQDDHVEASYGALEVARLAALNGWECYYRPEIYTNKASGESYGSCVGYLLVFSQVAVHVSLCH